MKHSLTLSLFFLALSSSSSWAVTTFVSTSFDRSAWEAAVPGLITNDGFDTPMAQSNSLNFASGVTSVATGLTGSANHLIDFDSTTSSNTFNVTVNTASSSVGGYTTITWTLPTAVYAFGADFLSIGGSREVGPTGVFDSGSQHFILRDEFGGTDRGFFGVVSSTPFTEITIEATGSISSNDAIRIDNLAFAVPEPSSSMLLLSAGVFGMSIRRRR